MQSLDWFSFRLSGTYRSLLFMSLFVLEVVSLYAVVIGKTCFV